MGHNCLWIQCLKKKIKIKMIWVACQCETWFYPIRCLLPCNTTKPVTHSSIHHVWKFISSCPLQWAALEYQMFFANTSLKWLINMLDDYCSQHQCFALNLAQGNQATRNLHCNIQLLCHVIKALRTSVPCNE